MSDETVWLTREQMAEQFQRDRSVIGKHIKNKGMKKQKNPETMRGCGHTAFSGKEKLANKTVNECLKSADG